MSIPRWLASVAALCLVLACSACQGQGESKGSEYIEPKLAGVGVVDSTIVLPFDNYALPVSELEQMARGNARLFERCLGERGISVPHDAYFGGDFIRGVDERPDETLMWGGPFGTLDAAHAQRYGYHASPTGPYAQGPGFYLSSPDNVSLGGQASAGSERAERELEGPLENGKTTCRAEVEEKIAAPMPDLSDLVRDTSKLAMGHPQVAPRLSAWVKCMSDAGHPGFEHVYDAEMSIYMGTLSEKEITLATDDVECTRSSRWADFYYAAVADYQDQAIVNNPDLFSGALAAARKRADSIASLVGQDDTK